MYSFKNLYFYKRIAIQLTKHYSLLYLNYSFMNYEISNNQRFQMKQRITVGERDFDLYKQYFYQTTRNKAMNLNQIALRTYQVGAYKMSDFAVELLKRQQLNLRETTTEIDPAGKLNNKSVDISTVALLQFPQKNMKKVNLAVRQFQHQCSKLIHACNYLS